MCKFRSVLRVVGCGLVAAGDGWLGVLFDCCLLVGACLFFCFLLLTVGCALGGWRLAIVGLVCWLVGWFAG